MANRWAVWGVCWGLVLLPSAASAFDHVKDGAIGGYVGIQRFFADRDARSQASPRFNFSAIGEYASSENWGMRFDVGWGWNSYPEDKTPVAAQFDDPSPVLTIWNFNLGFIRRLSPETGRFSYVGFGPGLYSWQFKVNGDIQRDPQTNQKIESGKVFGADPGLYGLIGYEYTLGRTVALNLEGVFHYVFSANSTDRPDKTGEFAAYPAFNGNLMYVVLRLGARVYFDLGRLTGPENDF